MQKFDVEYYENPDGTFPVEEFILKQETKMRARLFRLIELLECYGNNLREPYSKHLEEGIFEIRAKQGTDTIRILYFFIIGRKIILTNGFVKKTQKTPNNQIEIAKKCRYEYENRKEKN